MDERTSTPSNPVLQKMGMPNCAATLGYEFLSVDHEAQSMRVRFQGTEAMLNPRGTIQGGFLAAMLDDVMGSMIFVLTNGTKGPVSVDLHSQYFAPAFPGPIIGEARIKHMERKTVFTEGELTNEAGQKLASAIQTQKLVSIREGG